MSEFQRKSYALKSLKTEKFKPIIKSYQTIQTREIDTEDTLIIWERKETLVVFAFQ